MTETKKAEKMITLNQLRAKSKITIATLKSFAKKNAGNLYAKEVSSFDGMTDCVERNPNAIFNPTEMNEDTGYYKTGIQGVYTVGCSRDYFDIYEDNDFFGIKVYNSCGTSILASKK